MMEQFNTANRLQESNEILSAVDGNHYGGSPLLPKGGDKFL
jgi:hypothetical protein